MNKIFDIITLASALFLAVYLRHIIQSFSFMSLKELRRRAAAGNDQAARVLSARSHGLKLWLVLWSVLGLMIFIIVKTLGYLMTFWLSAAIAVAVIVSLLFVMPWGQNVLNPDWTPPPRLALTWRVFSTASRVSPRYSTPWVCQRSSGLTHRCTSTPKNT